MKGQAAMTHLLVVSPDPQAAALCRGAGHVVVAAGAHELMDRLFMVRPDLLVLDLPNPRPFARAVRDVSPYTRVVAICDDLDLIDQLDLRKAGVDTILFRPYSAQALERAIATLLPAEAHAPETLAWSYRAPVNHP
jgi:DNA-binding NarL/FixJ family response regulator